MDKLLLFRFHTLTRYRAGALRLSFDRLAPRSMFVACRCPVDRKLAVSGNAMDIPRADVRLAIEVFLGGCPREVVTANLNIVVRKFAKLVVVHTHELGLLGGTELQPGDSVDGEGKDEGDDEGVCGHGKDVGDLNIELLPVLVDETAGDASVDPVKTNNVVGSEETVENETDHTSDTVLSEDIHSVINPDEIFDCCTSALVIISRGRKDGASVPLVE